MLDSTTVLRQAAEQNNLQRVRFREAEIPTSVEKITVLLFFGDLRSTCIMSSLLLRRIKEELKGSKYFILVSWPGLESMFPFVDEYWTIKDETAIEKLNQGTDGFNNTAAVYTLMRRGLNKWFYDVIEPDIALPYYNNGITEEFFNRFRHVKVQSVDVPSAASLGEEFLTVFGRHSGFKVFLYPSKYIYGWRRGKPEKVLVRQDFWRGLLEKLVQNNLTPVVWKGYFTYDMSGFLTNECINLSEKSMFKILGAIRATGCVLDMFSGVSKLALAAKTPFLAFDERARYFGQKDYEVDDLCGVNLPKEYIFGFSTIIEGGSKSDWDRNLFDNVVVKLNSILPKLDRDSWPSTASSYNIVPYENVRKHKVKRLGARFIRRRD